MLHPTKYTTFPNGENKAIRRLINARLRELGWEQGDYGSFDGVDQRTSLPKGEQNSIGLMNTIGDVNELGDDGHVVGSLHKLFNTDFYRVANVVVLNSTHTAVVNKEGIKVGCQNFSHDAIDKLYRASKRARKQS